MSSDAIPGKYLRTLISNLLQRGSSPGEGLARTREFYRSFGLPSGSFDLEYRHLFHCGISFGADRDSLCFPSSVMAYPVVHTQQSIEALHRSFRKWTGMTPQQYRTQRYIQSRSTRNSH